MFTNWLTNPSPLSRSSSLITSASPGPIGHTTTSSIGQLSSSQTSQQANNNHIINNGSSNLISSPPDVILEVGPTPSVRFVAHGLILSMHSGYLRSAIRLDENTSGGGFPSDLVLFLGNVTAEQFAPLLTYMYTGYLDLNVENIFGVLLATHVLHMPRALEICRSFLSRTQSEGLFLSNGLPLPPTSSSSNNNGKIIRPIASKATIPISIGFIAPPMAHHVSLPSAVAETPFTSLNHFGAASDPGDEIDVVRNYTTESGDCINKVDDEEDEEEEELFVESNSNESYSAEAADKASSTPLPDLPKHQGHSSKKSTPPSVSKFDRKKSHHPSKREKIRKMHAHHRQTKSPHSLTTANTFSQSLSSLATGQKTNSTQSQQLESTAAVATLTTLTEDKIIIDVASCDGPIRFRRILNDAYGNKPEIIQFPAGPERTQQSVSLSFHQQMAKTISQRQMHSEESENSECGSNVVGGGDSGNGGLTTTTNNNKNSNNGEIYICVYCKHTFKSQYCYQKHAKRHLNPLSLSCGGSGGGVGVVGGATTDLATAEFTKLEHSRLHQIRASANSSSSSSSARDAGKHQLTTAAATSATGDASSASAAELLRREVRPLDMNVQYYPCKTCGSKFPSYYFVHKHRKMCHANEETAATNNGSGMMDAAIQRSRQIKGNE